MQETTQKQLDIQELIKSDSVDKSLNVVHQNRHIRDSDGYIDGRSYLYDGVDPEALIERYHGTGQVRFSTAGAWINKEFVTLDRAIGVHIDPDTGVSTPTNIFAIHYSKRRGAHIVPARRD